MSLSTLFRKSSFVLTKAVMYPLLLLSYAGYDPDIKRTSAGKGKDTLTCIGDSISAGMCSSTWRLASKDNFAAYLSERMGSGLVNLSFPFATSYDAVRQAERMPESDYAVILIGANDVFSAESATDFRSNLRRTISTAKKRAKAVFLIGLPDFSSMKKMKSRRVRIIRSIIFFYALLVWNPDIEKGFDEFDSIAKSVAREQGVGFVGIHKIGFSDNEIGADAFHPGPAGHRMIADEVYKVIKKMG